MTYAFKLSTTTAAAVLAFSGAVSASTMVETFDTDPPIAENQAPGVYYEDRYPPAGFESENFDGDNRLKVTLSEEDGRENRDSQYVNMSAPGFYNTQGRKLDTPGAVSASIDFYISSDFVSDPNRVAGLWGTAVNAANAISAYPIIEFADGMFQIWNGLGFEEIGDTYAADQWVEIGFALNPGADTIDYFLNGTLSFTDSANGSESLDNIIIQGYNTNAGIDRTLYFDNLSVTTPAVPLPAGLPLIASAIGIFGALRLRSRKAA